jgi:predicted transcriptional regulator
MSTTTVRLDAAEERTLDQLALVHGGRSNALRQGLKLLAATDERDRALTEFLNEWEIETGAVSSEEIVNAVERYGL